MFLTADHEEFAGLVRHHQSMVYSLIRRLLGDAAVAEELTQDVFVELYRHYADIESERHLIFWLRQVAGRRALDQLRRRRPRVSMDRIPEPAAKPTAAGDPWLHERLQRLVATLPVEQRMAVLLRYQEDLEPAEIAALMRMSVNTIKSRLQRGLKALRDALGVEELVTR